MNKQNETKKCKYCQTEIDAKAKICPMPLNRTMPALSHPNARESAIYAVSCRKSRTQGTNCNYS